MQAHKCLESYQACCKSSDAQFHAAAGIAFSHALCVLQQLSQTVLCEWQKTSAFANTARFAHAALTGIANIANAVAITEDAVASSARAAVSGGTPVKAVVADQPEGCPAEPPGQSQPPTAGGLQPQLPTQPGPVSLGTPCNDPSPAQSKAYHCNCQADWVRLL